MSWGNANGPINGPYQSLYLKPPDGHAHTHKHMYTHTRGNKTTPFRTRRHQCWNAKPNQSLKRKPRKSREQRKIKNMKLVTPRPDSCRCQNTWQGTRLNTWVEDCAQTQQDTHVMIWAPHASLHLHSTAEPASVFRSGLVVLLCGLWERKKQQKDKKVWSIEIERDGRCHRNHQSDSGPWAGLVTSVLNRSWYLSVVRFEPLSWLVEEFKTLRHGEEHGTCQNMDAVS